MTNNSNKQTMTYEDYRRLSHRLVQGLDVWVKGLHVKAVALSDEHINSCSICPIRDNCDTDVLCVCGECDERTGYNHILTEIDDNPPAQLA